MPHRRRCGCKQWAHRRGCPLGLGTANTKRKQVNYCSTRPNKPKRRVRMNRRRKRS